MGRAVNGVYFSKREVTYDELVRFLNSVRLSDEVLKKYFMLHSNSVAKYIKRDFENGVAHYFVYKGYENYPVTYVSWAGANAYITWLNSQSKFYYRLPSQNEWESVAEFGLAGVVEGTLSPVGTKPANTLGLYDIFGNVAEWGQDDEGEFSKVVFGGSYQTLHGYMSATMRNSMNKYSSKNSDIGFRLVR
jgi:formylglycine-generating enzyme required for sulfatase activity